MGHCPDVCSVYIKYLCENVPTEYMGTLQVFLNGMYLGLGERLWDICWCLVCIYKVSL